MITYYPSALQQSSSFAVSSSATLNAINTPETASFAEYNLSKSGSTGPTLTVQAAFVYGS